MFMAEAGTIGLIGGAAGLLLAAIVSVAGNVVVNNIAAAQGIPLDLSVFRITWWLVAGALVLAVGFSALSGFLPALRASRLDPVTALRYEWGADTATAGTRGLFVTLNGASAGTRV